jgi:hypothetical protein
MSMLEQARSRPHHPIRPKRPSTWFTAILDNPRGGSAGFVKPVEPPGLSGVTQKQNPGHLSLEEALGRADRGIPQESIKGAH